MSFFISTVTIFLIACHGGPAEHFATFAEALSAKGRVVEVYASGPAAKKFSERGIAYHPFFLEGLSVEEEDLLASQMARIFGAASLVITDVGHRFDQKLHQALSQRIVPIPHLAYYDNPESYVPGGFSKVAAEVMWAADAILFANPRLTTMPIFQERGQEILFGNREKIGIGYYPTFQAEHIFRRRSTEKNGLRQAFLQKNTWIDNNQKILVYFGGNNQEYFTKAFPFFLKLLEEGMQQMNTSNFVILLQQHPGAKEKNLDASMLLEWINAHASLAQHAPTLVVSDLSIEEAQILADGALYYQTSMAPQLVLAGIPTVQIGHETVEDLLVKNQWIPSVTHVREWIKVLDDSIQMDCPSRDSLARELGFQENWLFFLEQALDRMGSSQPSPTL